MAGLSSIATTSSSHPLLLPDDNNVVSGVVDCKGRPARCSTSGGWRAAFFILVVEAAEAFAYMGIYMNLVTYLTGPMGESTAMAAETVNVWVGVAAIVPLLGAFVADSYLGRYKTILFASLLALLGFGMLSLSTMMPALRPRPTTIQSIALLTSLYMVAIGHGVLGPCLMAMGADQFDQLDPAENKARSSFFNWRFFAICVCSVLVLSVLTYIQDNVSWGLGFGVPCASMAVALCLFLLGTATYRYTPMLEGKSPFVRLGKMLAAKIRPSKHPKPANPSSPCREEDECEYGSIVQLVPLATICSVYTMAYAQLHTLFTKQASTMNRKVGPHGFLVSPASFSILSSFSNIIFIPIYDRILVPIARSFTGIPSGVTVLQRIGIGLAISVLSMVSAAAVEVKRLESVGKAGAELPMMSVWWQVPQYVLFGVSESFAVVGLQELSYREMPEQLKSLGPALSFCVLGLGSVWSAVLISGIDVLTKVLTGESWFPANLNRAHLDYFFLLLAALSMLALGLYVHFARSYVYRMERINVVS